MAPFRDQAPTPVDPPSFGPATWGPLPWLGLLVSVGLFLLFIRWVARVASPEVPSESAGPDPDR